jgi:hypothetical protein
MSFLFAVSPELGRFLPGGDSSRWKTEKRTPENQAPALLFSSILFLKIPFNPGKL